MATRVREKAENRRKEKDNRPMAKVTYCGFAPSKARIVLDNIRGKKVDVALALMEQSQQNAAQTVAKLLKSAIANAENNKGLDRSTLVVAETWAGPGPLMKRLEMRAKGRANRILKRSCHMTIILDEAK